jgi:hypothetical protein
MLRYLMAVVFAAGLASAQAQDLTPEVLRAPAPDWVIPVEPPQDRFAVDPVNGARYLVSDRQTNLAAAQPVTFIRTLVEVTTPAGLETAAAWQIEFDPTYQTATLHRVRIIRGTASIDKSGDIQLDILRREENLDRQMYDGRYTASIQVPGVAVGDVVEIAYSITGQQPAFRGQLFARASTSYGVPVGQLFSRVIWPADHGFNFRTLDLPDTAVTQTRAAGMIDVRFGPAQVEDRRYDSGTPAWRQRQRGFEITEFDDWNALAGWAAPWFDSQIAPGQPELVAYAADIRAGLDNPSALSLAEAALVRVQNDVRYLAVSLGDGGFVPRPVNETLASRSGDCKDKTVLLISVLRSFGLQAEPALVGLSLGRGADSYLPSMAPFNHVIVRFTVDGQVYWLDPTRGYQSGHLADNSLYQPDYGFALPLESGSGLIPMAEPGWEYPVTRLIEETVDASDGAERAGFLSVHAEYRLDEADTVRRYYAAQGRRGLQTYFTDLYERRFLGLQIVEGGFTLTDDAETNTITIDIRYAVPVMFQLNRNIRYLEMLTYGIPRAFPEDVSGARTNSAQVTFPVNAIHRTRLDLQGSNQRWHLRAGHRRIANAGFIYEFNRRADGSDFIFEHTLQTLTPEISADEVQEVFDESQEMNANRNLAVWRAQ